MSFGWSLLSPPNRDRYLDLILLPPDATVCASLFTRLWSSAKRGDSKESAALPSASRPERQPLHVFARTSMLIEEAREGIVSYRLHDLYRLWMEYEVARSHRSTPQRHADLLMALGFMDASGNFLLDEEKAFRNA